MSTISGQDDNRRHCINTFGDYSPENSTNIINHSTNEINHDMKTKLHEVSVKLLKKLEDDKKSWINRDDASVYTGITGIIYMYYLSCQRLKNFSHEAKRQMEIFLDRSDTLKSSKRDITFLTGEAGRLAVGAVIYHSWNNQSKSLSMISKLKLIYEYATAHSYDELLYGRVGYLYALLFVNKNIRPAPIEKELIKKIIDCILSSGRKYSKARSYTTPLMYSWHEKEYLGGAHGLGGILYILLQAREFLTEEQLMNDVLPSIKYLQSLQFSSGNFPSSIGNKSDKLIHWCHGAPSMTMLFSLAYQVFNDESFFETARDCGEVVWERGLLKKGCGICHGVAGNAYTFLCLYQLTKDLKYLYRALKFGEWCFAYKKRQNRTPDRPYSLFEGLAGIIYFLLDLMDPLHAKFPSYTL